jgi:hypothetical protein
MQYDDPYIAGAPAQLSWHIGMDGILYCREMQTGVVYKLLKIGSDVQTPAPPAGGGGSAGAVQKTGDSMSGPLAVTTSTKPELHLADAAGNQTLDLNNTGLKLADPVVGNSAEINLANLILLGSGAASGASANKTTIGVNYLAVAHKTFNLGNSPVSLYQSNQGELFVQFTTGQNIRITDYANNRFVVPTNSLAMTSPTAGLAAVTLTLNDTGDIIATQQTGPNAGKSVNLTFGKWA